MSMGGATGRSGLIAGTIVLAAVFSVAAGAVEKSPEGMILIPAGPFVMGSSEKDGRVGLDVGVDEVPVHRVKLPAFRIDRYEVTVAEYQAFLRATGRKPPGDPKFPDIYPWKETGGPPPEIARHPVIYVDWSDADAYCRWAGKRLPTEPEWEKAARGTDGRWWPWGNAIDPKRANVQQTEFGGTAEVGRFEGDRSPYGVQDMAGNVAEWTASWYQPYPGSTLVRQTFGEKLRVIRGGAWVLNAHPYSRASHRSMAQKPEKRHRAIGFRCAMDAK